VIKRKNVKKIDAVKVNFSTFSKVRA